MIFTRYQVGKTSKSMLKISQNPNILLEEQQTEVPSFKKLMELAKTANSPVNAYHYAIKAKAQAQLSKNENQIALVDLLLVNILTKNGAYQEALNKNTIILQYFQEKGMFAEEAKGWRYLAVIHGHLGNYDKQLEYNKKSLSILQKLGDHKEEIQLLNNIGTTYLNLKLYDKAKAVFEMNLNNPKSDKLMIILSTKNLGSVHFEKKEFQKAKVFFKKVEKLAKDKDLSLYSNASDSYLGMIYKEEGNDQLACEYLIRAIESLEKSGTHKKELKTILENIIVVLNNLSRCSSANIYFKKYIQLNEEIAQHSKDQILKAIQFKFEINEIEKRRILLEKQNKKLKEANEKIKSQSKSLKEKSEALITANQELKHFAFMVSHDIKQPIRTISNFSRLLEREVKNDLTDNAKEYLNIMQSSTQRITTFVEDILKYATADSTSNTVEDVDCNEILNLVKLNLEFQLKETKGQLLFENLPTLQGHKSLILQVFQNLITNAIKFRREGVSPIVKVEGKETAEYFNFEISDNGIGIKEEYKENVFKLFQRLNNRDKFEGSGIGLNTVIKILKKYNGIIDFESEFGKGTTFKIAIPKNSAS